MASLPGPSPRYLLIGDGRLARSLAPWLAAHGAVVATWSRRAEAAGAAPSLELAAKGADVALLAVRDDAIAGLGTHPALRQVQGVHFSGARDFADLIGLHPLYAFPLEPVPAATFDTIPFITTDAGATFATLFPGRVNPVFAIAPADKALYHALAVIAGNLVTHVWNRTAAVFDDELALPPAPVLVPYLRSLVAGFAAAPRDSLTGPVRRGDAETMAANLAALAPFPALEGLYRALVTAVGKG